MNGVDPAKKQYFMFATVISIIISVILNFMFVGSLEGSFLYGFPFSLEGAGDATAFIYKILNSLIMAIFLIVPVYYFINWIQNKGGYF